MLKAGQITVDLGLEPILEAKALAHAITVAEPTMRGIAYWLES